MTSKSYNQSVSISLILLFQISLAVTILLLGFIFQADWAEKFMVGVGMIKPMHSQVDYYSYVKGLEYLLCVYYFFTFPVFFIFINTRKKK